MNILITGGNGFLGFNLVKKFLSEGHNLYVFSKDTSNLKTLETEIQINYSYTNEINSHKEAIHKFSPDIVIHCGWSGGNSYKDINDVKQVHDNISPGVDFIKILGELPKKTKFIGFGSFLEYGDYPNPIKESFKENPLTLYGLSKYTFKNYSKMLCDFYGMEWVWLRPCYVYGPYDVKTRLVPSLINKFLNNETVLLDECNKNIDYLYVDDFVELTYKLILTNNIGVFNVCSGVSYNLKKLINMIYTLSESKSQLIFDSKLNREFTSPYICGNNSKIVYATGIDPKVNIEVGLLKTINYIIKNK
jgi:nucleoside-diphosphate-sugar epimerase